MSKPVFLLGEAFGEHEARTGKGFVGPSGVELLRMLDDASVISLTSEDKTFISKFYATNDPTMIEMVWNLHPELYRSNVFQLHPPGNKLEHFCGDRKEGIRGYPALLKSKYVRAEFIPQLERLADELTTVDPNLVVALGNTALWALAGRTGVKKLRGTTCVSTHTATGYKLLVSYHPAAVLRQWEIRPTTVIDLMKINKEREYPEVRRPKREIWIEPGIEDIERFRDEYIIGCRLLSIDIETVGTRITCIGFSPKPSLALVVPFDDGRSKNRSYWASSKDESTVYRIVKEICGDHSIPKLFQNGLYDIAFLWRAYGIKTYGFAEDTMLNQHALQPESLKGLGYLGSLYTSEGPWKNERKGTETIKRDE